MMQSMMNVNKSSKYTKVMSQEYDQDRDSSLENNNNNNNNNNNEGYRERTRDAEELKQQKKKREQLDSKEPEAPWWKQAWWAFRYNRYVTKFGKFLLNFMKFVLGSAFIAGVCAAVTIAVLAIGGSILAHAGWAVLSMHQLVMIGAVGAAVTYGAAGAYWVACRALRGEHDILVNSLPEALTLGLVTFALTIPAALAGMAVLGMTSDLTIGFLAATSAIGGSLPFIALVGGIIGLGLSMALLLHPVEKELKALGLGADANLSDMPAYQPSLKNTPENSENKVQIKPISVVGFSAANPMTAKVPVALDKNVDTKVVQQQKVAVTAA